MLLCGTKPVAFDISVVSTTTAALPGDARRWALAVARLPTSASTVLPGEDRGSPGLSACPAALAAWYRAAQAVARERSLWCEADDDGGRLLVLVLPFGLVPHDDRGRPPAHALCLACEPPEFAPVALQPEALQAVLTEALACVRPAAQTGCARDAWVPLSAWAAVPLAVCGLTVGVCVEPRCGQRNRPACDVALELPRMLPPPAPATTGLTRSQIGALAAADTANVDHQCTVCVASGVRAVPLPTPLFQTCQAQLRTAV